MKKQRRTNYSKQFKSELVEEFRKSNVELPEFAAAYLSERRCLGEYRQV